MERSCWNGYAQKVGDVFCQIEQHGSQLWIVEYRWSKTLSTYVESNAAMAHTEQQAVDKFKANIERLKKRIEKT